MKKIALTFILLISCSFGFSQSIYSNYLDMSSEWRTSYNGVGSLWYSTTYFDGYQTINGNTYYRQFRKTLNYIFYNNGTFTTEIILSEPSYVREDATGKFYIYDTTDGNEYVYMDNQQIIDSLVGDPFPTDPTSCNVEFIETISFGSQTLKRIKGNPTCANCGTLEGIGFVGPNCGFGIEGNTWLNCYTKQGISLQFGTIDCNSFPVPQRIYLSTDLDNALENELIVFPNPTHDNITIKSKNKVVTEYIIFNIQGTMLKNGKVENNEETINISDFESGIYIIKLIGQNTEEYKKIVKK
ncbi:T9SS type A sorting domain-containing protein [Flavobacterium sp.]|uniref:T9SS type A sorting domain-containing protein n=1 Tax=Flavobacterium sp. TaxID=239 RepID=UPI0026074411|nr:T9SS type A sorting domain-containing protein [Flavobacterium sp.]